MIDHVAHFIKHLQKKYLSTGISVSLFFILVFCLIFSNQPLLYFGMVSGVNLKLSLVVIVATLFCLATIPYLYRKRSIILTTIGAKLFLVFCLLNTASIMWSINKPRALFEVGFLWLLFVLFISIQIQFKEIIKYKKLLMNILWASTIFVCLFSLWQVFGDAAGISSAFTLLPIPYQSAEFGFARPTGFALEPQFLGSFLLIPILVAIHALLSSRKNILAEIVLVLTSLILVLTISRGAVFGIIVGGLILILAVRSTLVRIVKVCGLIIVGAVLALGVAYLAANINLRDGINGQSAIIGIVNQMSFGTIKLDQVIKPTVTASVSVSAPPTPGADPAATPSTAVTPVYVEQSTSSRLAMSHEAITNWTHSPNTFLLGTGTGSFGAIIHERNSSYIIGSIVNNEFLQVASELGLIGLMIFLGLLVLPIYMLVRSKQWLLVGICSAFSIQWLFFSGNINVLHLWLILALAYSSAFSRKDQFKHKTALLS